MNLAKLEAEHLQDISFDFDSMRKIIKKEFKKLTDIDEMASFICELRARSWYWQEEDHPDDEAAHFYNYQYINLMNWAGTKMSKSDYMDFYYAIDPNP